MTRKHYRRLAANLKIDGSRAWADDGAAAPRWFGDGNPSRPCWATFLGCVDSVCAALKDENPRFDRNTFLTACGIDPVTREPINAGSPAGSKV